MPRSLIAASLLFITAACGSSEPPPEEAAEAYLHELTESDGELGDLAMDEHSNELNLLSMTKIPRIDWSQVSGVRIDRSVPRGPGKLSPQVPDVSIEAVEYAGTLYKKLVAIDVSFTLTMEDGGAHSGVLSLRPVEGVLKILPAREAWD